jgi:hypothetical protein
LIYVILCCAILRLRLWYLGYSWGNVIAFFAASLKLLDQDMFVVEGSAGILPASIYQWQGSQEEENSANLSVFFQL